MRKIFSAFIGLVVCIFVCKGQINSRFNVKGNVKGLKAGSKLFLIIKIGDKVDTVSRSYAKSESFQFNNVKLPCYPDFYLISIQTEFVDNLKLFLDQAGDVKISGDLKKWPDVEIFGSETHQDYLACRQLRKNLQAKDFLLKYPEGSALADTITMYTLKECREMIMQRPNSCYLAYWLATMQHPLESQYPQYRFTPKMKQPLYDLFSAKVKASRYGQILERQISDFEKKKLWMEKLKKSIADLKSISRDEVLSQLLETANRKVEVSSLAISVKQLSIAELEAKIKAATVIVNMGYRNPGDSVTRPNPTSAYLIDENGVCVTNYHVGKEYSSKELYKALSIMTSDGKSYPVTKILSCSESDDLMVFQVETKGDKLSALPLGNRLADGAKVYVMGHPLGKFYEFTSGKVSGYSTATLAGKPCNIMSITADFNVGSSGGPIVDDFGNVVGTVSRIDGGMKVAVPVSELKKLIEFKK